MDLPPCRLVASRRWDDEIGEIELEKKQERLLVVIYLGSLL